MYFRAHTKRYTFHIIAGVVGVLSHLKRRIYSLAARSMQNLFGWLVGCHCRHYSLSLSLHLCLIFFNAVEVCACACACCSYRKLLSFCWKAFNERSMRIEKYSESGQKAPKKFYGWKTCPSCTCNLHCGHFLWGFCSVTLFYRPMHWHSSWNPQSKCHCRCAQLPLLLTLIRARLWENAVGTRHIDVHWFESNSDSRLCSMLADCDDAVATFRTHTHTHRYYVRKGDKKQ